MASNHSLRPSWTAPRRCLRSTAVDNWGHSFSSLTWLSRRGVQITRMLMRVEYDAWRIRGYNFLQLELAELVEL